MRATGAASAALLGAAALALTAPSAGAVDPFLVSPSTVNPGGRVVLSAPGCPGTAMASSDVFDTVTVPAGGSATATVDWDARRGTVYTVSFTCAGGSPGSARLTIAPARTGSTAVPTVTRTATVTTAPSGVRGGLGGSVDTWNAGELAAGGALVAAATAGAVHLVRRRTASHRH
ncbi:hypothetical protein M4914_22865 [Streptomyces somaliensis DSM 40738]|uniref:Lipoprotein n=1 Tax=Streptomyces somaliensis (strain ATCC 33201 / DSM 40738 / JCM 12659 / KCTC 9044 / NCTC 11332 / NRRL B-12077 / IP 733) TaxID=1134445 RepID=A0AA44DFY8_STRE0|nr:hypothetical protein [Streptomyces somaliensis]MCQ0025495.1 hypothetical protein [Streptomyces somaliensis DSM 40738]NKY15738.1 hypothetical protein [Streptomyces somaliensis DSM 40738]